MGQRQNPLGPRFGLNQAKAGDPRSRINPQYHALEAEASGSTLRLIVYGNKMEGTLKTANNVIYRRIHLQRAD